MEAAVGVELRELRRQRLVSHVFDFGYCFSYHPDNFSCMRFAWDPAKETANIAAHGVDFSEAKRAFEDPRALVIFDAAHSTPHELRWWLLGKVKTRIMLVRYTHRPGGTIRIIGAGFWRQGKELYEKHWQENH